MRRRSLAKGQTNSRSAHCAATNRGIHVPARKKRPPQVGQEPEEADQMGLTPHWILLVCFRSRQLQAQFLNVCGRLAAESVKPFGNPRKPHGKYVDSTGDREFSAGLSLPRLASTERMRNDAKRSNMGGLWGSGNGFDLDRARFSRRQPNRPNSDPLTPTGIPAGSAAFALPRDLGGPPVWLSSGRPAAYTSFTCQGSFSDGFCHDGPAGITHQAHLIYRR